MLPRHVFHVAEERDAGDLRLWFPGERHVGQESGLGRLHEGIRFRVPHLVQYLPPPVLGLGGKFIIDHSDDIGPNICITLSRCGSTWQHC